MTPARDSGGTSPGRTPTITREALVAAGLRVLERDGLDALTMRKVAAELDVQAPSLYWHVRDKEELIDLLGDALSADLDVDLPEDADWREQVRVLAHRYRDHLKAHRDAVRVIGGRFLAGPHAAVGMERALRVFREAGFCPGDAAAAMYMVSVVFVQGFVLQETVPMRAIEATGGTPEDAMAVVAGELAALPEPQFPRLAEATPYLVAMNLDERFAWGLELIIEGLATRLAAGTGPTTR
jgi:TetR/AcrR family tetracycline transcriptional repressor